MLWDSLQQPDNTILQTEPVSKGETYTYSGGKFITQSNRQNKYLMEKLIPVQEVNSFHNLTDRTSI